MLLRGLMVPRAVIGPPAVLAVVVGRLEGVGDAVAGGLAVDARGDGVALAVSPVGATMAVVVGCGARCCIPAATARPPRPVTPSTASVASETLSQEACFRLRNDRVRSEPSDRAIPRSIRTSISSRSGWWASAAARSRLRRSSTESLLHQSAGRAGAE